MAKRDKKKKKTRISRLAAVAMWQLAEASKKHPGEYVIFVGRHVYEHHADRRKVEGACTRAFQKTGERPVVVAPRSVPRLRLVWGG